MKITKTREMEGLKITTSLEIDEEKQNVNEELIGFVIDKIGLSEYAAADLASKVVMVDEKKDKNY